MKIIYISLRTFLYIVFIIFISINNVDANNLKVQNVSLETRTPSSDTVVVEFDLSWDNSWRTKFNHDAVWVTVRLNDPSASPTNKKLCQISASGLNPSGSSIGSATNLEMYVPSDKLGVFIRPSEFTSGSSVSTTDLQLKVDYNSCGFGDSDSVDVSVFGIEMVYIPEGAFHAGDYGTSTASLVQGSSDSDPWHISSEAAISVSNPTSDGYRYVSAGNAGESLTGASFTLPSDYPKGFDDVYAMKYEINEGQWVEFINSLPSASARSNHDLTDGSHKNSDTVRYRNTISCSGSPLSCSTTRPYRAVTYLTWMDLAAFLDWAALRPMSELEFEKFARGPVLAAGGEFAWGTATITAAAAISGSSEDGTETITTTDANANYNDTTLTGGDTSNGTDYEKGALRNGIFATTSSSRESSGASYYGVMELSGNVAERVVTIGNTTGVAFKGTNGDGVLTTESGYEGNANVTDWPGMDGVSARGVTGSTGSGYRGGAWDSQSSGAELRISDRTGAANGTLSSTNNVGGRGVRTYDE